MFQEQLFSILNKMFQKLKRKREGYICPAHYKTGEENISEKMTFNRTDK